MTTGHWALIVAVGLVMMFATHLIADGIAWVIVTLFH